MAATKRDSALTAPELDRAASKAERLAATMRELRRQLALPACALCDAPTKYHIVTVPYCIDCLHHFYASSSPVFTEDADED